MIETLKFEFYNKELLTGITLKNNTEELPYGFSINKGNLYNDLEVNTMRSNLAETLDLQYSQMVFLNQIHSDIVEKYSNFKNKYECDAIITNQLNICLNISVADCIGLILFDKFNKILGGVHSGWKGTQQNITKNTLLKMEKEYGTNSKNVVALISPSASGNVYEIGADVAQYFPLSIKEIGNSKFLFDNKNEVKIQLLNCGLQETNIKIQHECTITDNRFHSYRRDKEKSGRMSVFAMMK